MRITGNFRRFQHFNSETNFLKNGNLFQKTGVPFLIEGTKIENATFAYKIHGCITKNRVIINYSIFWEILL